MIKGEMVAVQNLLQHFDTNDVAEIRRHVETGIQYCQDILRDPNGKAGVGSLSEALRDIAVRLNIPAQNARSEREICVWLSERYQRLTDDLKLLERTSGAASEANALMRILYLLGALMVVVVSGTVCFQLESAAIATGAFGASCNRLVSRMGFRPLSNIQGTMVNGSVVVVDSTEVPFEDVASVSRQPVLIRRMRDRFLPVESVNNHNNITANGSTPVHVHVVVGDTKALRTALLRRRHPSEGEPGCRFLDVHDVMTQMPGFDAMNHIRTVDGVSVLPTTTVDRDIVASLFHRPTNHMLQRLSADGLKRNIPRLVVGVDTEDFDGWLERIVDWQKNGLCRAFLSIGLPYEGSDNPLSSEKSATEWELRLAVLRDQHRSINGFRRLHRTDPTPHTVFEILLDGDDRPEISFTFHKTSCVDMGGGQNVGTCLGTYASKPALVRYPRSNAAAFKEISVLRHLQRRCNGDDAEGCSHVVPLWDITLDHTDKKVGIVMPHLQGYDLGMYFDHEWIVQHFEALAIKIYRGIRFLHRNGVVHCDIKPKNIMLHDASDDDWTATIIDLSSATRIGGEILGGSTQYMLQPSLSAAKPDQDWFAFVLTMYNVLDPKLFKTLYWHRKPGLDFRVNSRIYRAETMDNGFRNAYPMIGRLEQTFASYDPPLNFNLKGYEPEWQIGKVQKTKNILQPVFY